MSTDEFLTDDYVAGLLSQEASDCSIKYSAMGVDAFLVKDSKSKKSTNMPKPNTRFLRNIIRGTDTHNKALLAKEAAESKARLKRLERAEETKRKKLNPTTKDLRERHMEDIQAILGGGKRRGRDGGADTDNNKKETDRRDRAKAKRGARPHKNEDNYRDGDQRGPHEGRASSNYGNESSEHYGSRQHGRRRSQHKDRSADDEPQPRLHKSSRDGRSRSPGGYCQFKRTGSRDAERRRHRHRSLPRDRSSVSAENQSALRDSENEEIGPVLPPKIRGRGAVGVSSGIDRRFSASYDPKTDIEGFDDANI
ncbi:hypothetical protein BB8028_0005g07730 [Beauveria bassiana]|uniref:Pre-mRNA-splicing factor 38B n=1 Tax=Beauveria bassiana TaxID=176275 RepID=A0A2S7YH03_BEABA|nr:hypothetical protein BB8028_0005g07730 [Beauveria bassiana]